MNQFRMKKEKIRTKPKRNYFTTEKHFTDKV